MTPGLQLLLYCAAALLRPLVRQAMRQGAARRRAGRPGRGRCAGRQGRAGAGRAGVAAPGRQQAVRRLSLCLSCPEAPGC